MPYEKFPSEKLILRDYLASDRTLLANERTLLAYLRTAIMLFISGVTIVKLFENNIAMMVFGYVLVPLAFTVAILGYVRFRKTRIQIDISNRLTVNSDISG